MSVRGFVWTAALIVAAAALYSVYSQEASEKWAPAAGVYARKLHDLLPQGLKERPAAPASAEAKGPPPALVSVAQAKRADYPLYLEGLGQVQAFNTVTVRPRVDGQVVKI